MAQHCLKVQVQIAQQKCCVYLNFPSCQTDTSIITVKVLFSKSTPTWHNIVSRFRFKWHSKSAVYISHENISGQCTKLCRHVSLWTFLAGINSFLTWHDASWFRSKQHSNNTVYISHGTINSQCTHYKWCCQVSLWTFPAVSNSSPNTMYWCLHGSMSNNVKEMIFLQLVPWW